MKNQLDFYLLVCLALSLCLVGCGKSDPEPTLQTKATPTPETVDNSKDFSAKSIRHKADQAANSLEKFLKDQDPKLRNKVQHLADKVSDKLGKDKNHWREKLEEQRHALLPQIEQLKTQLGQVDGDNNKRKLKDALSKLEGKSGDTDKKLAELESAGADAWAQFKAQLKEDEVKENTPPTDDDETPTPTPRLRNR